jgi:aminopeptidase 2
MPVSALRTHPEGVEALFTWMMQNWDELTRRLPAGLSMLGSMVSLCTSGFTSAEQKKRVEDFFAARNTKGFAMGLAQSLDAVQAKSQWVARDREVVAKWIKDNGYVKN